jgi:TonB-linked SusC/RagA family outer membrane protein
LDRYLFTATFRADGSSKFAPNNRWGYFPAGAFAWRISEEPFMASTRKWLDNLKLRLSYGTAGSDGIDSNLWKETWETETVNVSGQNLTGYKPGSMRANPNLKWETTISRNVGIDFGFWNNKLHGSLDVYWNSTEDLLLKVPIDPSTGYSYQFRNVGETSNKGFELSLAWNIVRTKDFNLTVNGTYNYNVNNIESLAPNIQTDYASGLGSSMIKPRYEYRLTVGKPVGVLYGYSCDGFYTPNDFNYANGVYTLKQGVPDYDAASTFMNYPGQSLFNLPAGQNAFPGAVKLRDIAGNDGIVNADDVTALGEAMPKHTGGFNITASYKGFDFSTGLAFQLGGKVYNANRMEAMVGGKDEGLGKNRMTFIESAYRIFDVDGSGNLVTVTEPDALNALNQNAKYGLPFYENVVVLSTFIEDASFLRMNTLTLGYTIPKRLTKKFGCENFRVYATAGNLFCLTGYSGMDPEVNSQPTNNGFPTLGFDYNTYPRARTFTFGINLSF